MQTPVIKTAEELNADKPYMLHIQLESGDEVHIGINYNQAPAPERDPGTGEFLLKANGFTCRWQQVNFCYTMPNPAFDPYHEVKELELENEIEARKRNIKNRD